jgi:FAD/FMN-containing dehydrogenase
VLGGKVLLPDTVVYDKRLQSYYSSNSAQAAWCMVLPESTLDVSRIAQIISEHQCPFGIRSGAHSAFNGANAVKEGVTVDFGTPHSLIRYP